MTRRICLALDLVDDAALIAECERWRQMGRIFRLTEHKGLGD